MVSLTKMEHVLNVYIPAKTVQINKIVLPVQLNHTEILIALANMDITRLVLSVKSVNTHVTVVHLKTCAQVVLLIQIEIMTVHV